MLPLQMLGYVLGPKAYKSWYLDLHLTLREKVDIDTIHPRAMKDCMTQQIRHFLSPQVTTDMKSFRERGGTVAEYVLQNQMISQDLVDSLTASSSRRILQTVLQTSLLPAPVAPQGRPGGVKQPSVGKNKPDKSAKKHLSDLKGFCMHWLQHNQSPCQGPKCTGANKASLLHKTEWDTRSAEVKTKILAAAKVLSPGVTFKVQP